MKRVLTSIVVAVLALAAALPVYADKPTSVDANGIETSWQASTCANIQSGTIIDSAGNPVQVGFDQFGYNYQAHQFVGTYDSVDRTLDNTYWGQTGDFVDDKLMMKWSDDWLANVDCNGDQRLDRGLVNGVPSLTNTSLGWLTNHVEGDYADANGLQHYTDFVKIGYTGPNSPLWGSYSVVEEVYNDPAGGFHGLYDIADPGLGHYVTR